MSLKIQRSPNESWWSWAVAKKGATLNFIVTNVGNDRRVLTSVTIPLVSGNSGGQEFATTNNPNTSVQHTTTANGSEFTVVCELSFNKGATYDYSSEELTVPGQKTFNMDFGPNTSSAFKNSFRAPPWPVNYKFNFENVPAIDPNAQIYARVRVTEVKNVFNQKGSPVLQTDKIQNISDNTESKPEESPDPTSISLSPTTQYITDNNVTSTTADIFKNNTCTFAINKGPADADSVIRDPSITHTEGTEGIVKVSVSGSTITCTAASKNIDYPADETFQVSVRGGASALFTVGFYNKPTAEVSLSHKVLNIRTASNHSFERSFVRGDDREISEGKIWLTSNDGKTLTLSQKTFENTATSLNIANHTSNGLNFLNLSSNSKNIFKVNREHVPNKIKFKVYNKEVQNINPENVYASTQIIEDVYWSISPKDVRQLNFDWMLGTTVMATVRATGPETCDVSFKNDFDNLPDTVVIGLSGDKFPFIGNLRYDNDDSSLTAGYCRGMRIEYMYSRNESEDSVANSGRVFYYDKMSSSQSPISVSGRLSLDSRNIDNLDKLRDIYIRITPYFYFGSSRVTNTTTPDTSSTSEDKKRYFGSSFTLPQKFVYMTNSDFCAPFLFPTVKSSAPYTKMMLPQVERSGHLINKKLVDYKSISDKMGMGMRVGDTEVSMRKNPEYFSSTVLQPHVIVDIGHLIKDLSGDQSSHVLSSSTVFQPFIDIYDDEKYEVRVEFTDTVTVEDTGIAGNTNLILPTVIRLDTLLTSMWDPAKETPAYGAIPTVNKGELIFYHDYDNFQLFMNKYQNLIPNKATNNDSFTVNPVPVSKTTELISTDFWIEIARRISKYSESMQNWASSSSKLSWVKTKFTIPKGTVIDNLNPLASLFQNYQYLLTKCDGHENQAFATHKYLHDMGFTHKMLAKFTHKQIMNKEGM